MSVFKVEKTKDFTVMSNYHLRDNNLSLKAKGLLSYMLSLPEDWDYSLKGLCAICKESINTIRTILKELEDNNYLVIEKDRDEKGCFEYNYLIYEKPNCPDTKNPYMDEPDMDNCTQINTNIQNTNKQIDKGDKTISPFFVAEEHNRLTLELINRNYIDENDGQIFYYDNLFNELLSKNYSYQELLVYIHYIVPRVISNKFEDENGNDITNKFGYFKNAILGNIRRLESLPDELYPELDDY